MRKAVAAAEGHSERSRRSLYLCHIASAHASLGQLEVGLGLLDEAIQTAEITSEKFFEPELHRLRGKILLSLGKKGKGEAVLQHSLTIARQQQARWWELRAATNLASHWHDEGRYVEANSLLQPIYTWFVEGFDTPDLKNAKSLLDKLQEIDKQLARLGDLTRQVSESPHDPKPRTEAGIIFLRSGQVQEGLRWLASALQVDPQHRETRQALAARATQPRTAD